MNKIGRHIKLSEVKCWLHHHQGQNWIWFIQVALIAVVFFCLSEMQSVVKQNLHSECEGDINKLINLKLNASYTYLALVRIM